ncbi:uncharacterized protein LOC122258986 isoform X2 [Penaeus japonicus]|nr:uncharacterized protein LOC122258986 isoform X2 [Penaeus japonicus]XP_042881324.1 uncharacterized protein LOC122258986 isoform X2 [Penaeus japonicus]
MLVFVAVTILCAEATSPLLPQTVPVRPESVTLEKSSLFYLWDQQLHSQNTNHVQRDTRGIGTLLSPDHSYISNLVPQDTVHPLYYTGSTGLRGQLLQDHMIQDTVDPNDEKINSANGLVVDTLLHSSVVFKRNDQGKIEVNGIPVLSIETLPSGIINYTLDGILFDYQQRVHEAFEKLLLVVPPPFPFVRRSPDA